MSTLETIINPKQRKAKKGAKSAQAEAIYQALDSMEAYVLPLSALVQSELNVRKGLVANNKFAHFSLRPDILAHSIIMLKTIQSKINQLFYPISS